MGQSRLWRFISKATWIDRFIGQKLICGEVMSLFKQIYNLFKETFTGIVNCPHCGHNISIKGIPWGYSILLCQKCRTKFQYYSIKIKPWGYFLLLWRKCCREKTKYKFGIKNALKSSELTKNEIATIIIVLICLIFSVLSFYFKLGWVLLPIRWAR